MMFVLLQNRKNARWRSVTGFSSGTGRDCDPDPLPVRIESLVRQRDNNHQVSCGRFLGVPAELTRLERIDGGHARLCDRVST